MEQLISLLPNLDFKDEFEKDPELIEHIHEACSKYLSQNLQLLHNNPQKPKKNENYDNIVVLTGIPTIKDGPQANDKMLKLRSRIRTILIKHGIDFTQEQSKTNIEIPHSQKKQATESVAFIDMENETKAMKAVRVLDQYQLTNKLIFSAILFSKYDQIVNVPIMFQEPNIMPLSQVNDWMLNEDKDQMFMYYYGQSINVSTFRPDNEQKTMHVLLGAGSNTQTEQATMNRLRIEKGNDHNWSQNGRYLVCKYGQNHLQINGGEKFDLIRDLTHYGVDKWRVSPNETQIKTESKSQNQIIFWDIDTASEIRKFDFLKYASEFQWNSDGRFCARASLTKQQERTIQQTKVITRQSTTPLQISIYDTTSNYQMTINPQNNKKNSIKTVSGVHQFSWCKGGRPQIMMYISRDSVMEEKKQKKPHNDFPGFGQPSLNQTDNPKTIHIINVVTRNIILEKTILGAKQSQIYWHPSLQMFAIVKHRYLQKPKQSKKQEKRGPKQAIKLVQEQLQNSIEIFKIKKDSSQGYSLQIPDLIQGFAWHPTLPYFAFLKKLQTLTQITYGNACPSQVVAFSQKPGKAFSFQKIQDAISQNQGTAPNASLNTHSDTYSMIYWAPKSRALIAVNNKSLQQASTGKISFFIISDKNLLQHVKTQQHEGAQYMSWDSSGRFVASCYQKRERQTGSQEDTSIRIYNLGGELVFSKRMPGLKSFKWRPRISKILTNEEINKISKDMTEITKQLQKEEKQAKTDKQMKRKKIKQQKENEFMTYLNAKLEKHKAEKPLREKILGRAEEKVEIVFEEYDLEESIVAQDVLGIEKSKIDFAKLGQKK